MFSIEILSALFVAVLFMAQTVTRNWKPDFAPPTLRLLYSKRGFWAAVLLAPLPNLVSGLLFPLGPLPDDAPFPFNGFFALSGLIFGLVGEYCAAPARLDGSSGFARTLAVAPLFIFLCNPSAALSGHPISMMELECDALFGLSEIPVPKNLAGRVLWYTFVTALPPWTLLALIRLSVTNDGVWMARIKAHARSVSPLTIAIVSLLPLASFAAAHIAANSHHLGHVPNWIYFRIACTMGLLACFATSVILFPRRKTWASITGIGVLLANGYLACMAWKEVFRLRPWSY